MEYYPSVKKDELIKFAGRYMELRCRKERLFLADCEWDFPMIFFSRCLPLICRRASEFCLLIFYPGGLLNKFISCKIMFSGNGIYLLSLKTL